MLFAHHGCNAGILVKALVIKMTAIFAYLWMSTATGELFFFFFFFFLT